MTNEQPVYLSYLLRLWRVNGDGVHHGVEPHHGDEGSHRMAKKAIWRASLESSHTGERKGFANLDDLFAFLREQTGERPVKTPPDYLSYLLRLWRVNDDAGSVPPKKAVWQASLENPQTGEWKVFASLDDLFAFLREQTRVPSDS